MPGSERRHKAAERGRLTITDTGDTMLSHDGEEGGVIVQGQVEITVGERVKVVSRRGESPLGDRGGANCITEGKRPWGGATVSSA